MRAKYFYLFTAIFAARVANLYADDDDFFMPDISEIEHRDIFERVTETAELSSFKYKVAKEEQNNGAYRFILNNFEEGENKTDKKTCNADYNLQTSDITVKCFNPDKAIKTENKPQEKQKTVEKNNNDSVEEIKEEQKKVSKSEQKNNAQIEKPQANNTQKNNTIQSFDAEDIAAGNVEIQLDDISYSITVKSEVSNDTNYNCATINGNSDSKKFCFYGKEIAKIGSKGSFFTIETHDMVDDTVDIVYYTFRLMDGELYLHQYSRVNRLNEADAKGDLQEKTYIYYRSNRDGKNKQPSIVIDKVTEKLLNQYRQKYPRPIKSSKK
ncbi:MAG: hypothetical protein IJ566_05845 [Cardiobacteriaceae bacterium]|nr:hypothetical protein [Cardiobacteriaceae bacterium]